MSNNDLGQGKEQDNEWCKCPNCKGSGMYGMHHYGHRFFFLRLVFGLVILGIVFAVGVKIGEFKEEFRGYGRYDHTPMHGKMMQNFQYKVVPLNSTTSPSTSN